MTGHGPEQLRPVRWLSPTELLRTGVQAALAGVFGRYADKREMQQGPSFEQGCFDHAGPGEFWFDYVADTGDGFDATYSVATLLAGDVSGLQPDGSDLPRGRLLVLGGDQVYPAADARTYEQRTTRVFAAASPAGEGERPALYAIPGDHDWYDGLTAFLRVFCQEENVGGWQTRQRRSYFALRLPHRWWLLAVDIQLDTYIDRPQLDYFRRVVAEIGDDDSIVLCTAVPSWYQAGQDETSLDRLAYFLKHTLAGKTSRVRVVLTGDVHHYARYTRADADWPVLITAGLGGAYAAGTHLLPDALAVTARLADPEADKDDTDEYRRAPATWPTDAESRRAARGVLWRLVLRHPGLVGLFAALYALLAGSAMFAAWLWTATLLGLLTAAGVAFAKPRSGSKLSSGLSLAALQAAPAAAVVWTFATRLTEWSWWAQLLAAAAAAGGGGVLAAELLAIWLLVVSRGRTNENELFAAQGIEDHKGFLRIRIDADGVLTVFPVGVRQIVHHWRPSTSPTGSRLVPVDPDELRCELIEAPVVVPPAPRRPAHGAGPAVDGTAGP